MKHFYGYIPDKEDKRDFLYKAVLPAETLPSMIDLRKQCSPIRDQGQLGSCTWESMVGFREWMDKKATNKYTTLSVLFGYYNTRVDEGTPNEDSGCELRDCLKELNQVGTCPNKYWAYYISRFAKKPSANAYAHSTYKINAYHRLNTLQDVKVCLANGSPVIIGFTVYESFENISSNGIMPMPNPYEQVLGGHAVVVVGYDDTKQQLIVRNSWGKHWGAKGYFYMPYKFVTSDDVSDMWSAS